MQCPGELATRRRDEDDDELTFLAFSRVVGGLDESVRDIPVGGGAGLRMLGRGGRIVSGAGVMAQIVHAHTLAHVHAAHAVRQPHAEQAHAAVRARPAVVAIEAAVRAPPAHLVVLHGRSLA